MRLVSGIRPSSPIALAGYQGGTITIANYLGAMKQWLRLQEEYDAYVFLADLHAITTPYDPKEFPDIIQKTLAIYLATGLDPKRCVMFLQSQVPAHTELAWLLETITPVGELSRMVQYKEKLKEGAPATAGLFVYPVLMAADILLYKADAVPVGEDQLQHIELTRAIAEKFNKKFGETFPLPKAILPPGGAERIKALDDPKKKMSKSGSPDSYIGLLDSPDTIRRKMKTAVTDSGKEVRYDPVKKPAISNLLVIYSGFSGKAIPELERKFQGKGYAEFKASLAEVLVTQLAPIREKFEALVKEPENLRAVLEEGNKKARVVAERTLTEVKEKMGLR